jgi:hypothetical protein
MVRARIHVKLPRHLLAETIAWQHAAHGATNDLFGPAREERL